MIKLEDLHKYIGEKVYVIEPSYERFYVPSPVIIEKVEITKSVIGVDATIWTTRVGTDENPSSNSIYNIYATYDEAEEVCIKSIQQDIESRKAYLKSIKEKKQEIENEKHIDKH